MLLGCSTKNSLVFLSRLLGLLLLKRLAGVLGLLVESLLSQLFSGLHLLEGNLLFSAALSTQVRGVAADNADEVGEGDENDDGPGELPEDEVFLLVLDVALLGGAPAPVDGLAIVDPHEVDDSPSREERLGDDDHDAGAAEAATAVDAVLAEPNNEEGGSDVLRDQQNQVDEAVPPGNAVVQHQEELGGDADGGEQERDEADRGDATLDRDDAAAGHALGGLGLAIADEAAALLEHRGALLGVERAELHLIVAGEIVVQVHGVLHLSHRIRHELGFFVFGLGL